MHPRVTDYDKASYKIAMNNKDKGVPVDDLFQEARIAVDKALRSFDPGRGVRELTYVYFCVSRRIWECLRCHYKKTRYIMFCDELLSNAMHEMGIEDPSPELLDLKEGLKVLKPKEKEIVWSHVRGMTYRQIGKKYNLSSQRIQQIYARALRKMKARIEGTAK